MDAEECEDFDSSSHTVKMDDQSTGVAKLETLPEEVELSTETVKTFHKSEPYPRDDDIKHRGSSRNQRDHVHGRQRGRYRDGGDRSPMWGDFRGGMHADYERPKGKDRWNGAHQSRFHKQARMDSDSGHYHSADDQQMRGNDAYTKARSARSPEHFGRGDRASTMHRTNKPSYRSSCGATFSGASGSTRRNSAPHVPRNQMSPNEGYVAPTSQYGHKVPRGQVFFGTGRTCVYGGGPGVPPFHGYGAVKPRERQSLPAVANNAVMAPVVSTRAPDSRFSVDSAEVTAAPLPLGPLDRMEVLSCLLQMGAYTSTPEHLLNVARSFIYRKGYKGDFEVICDVLIDCVSSLLPKSAAYAGLVYAWAYLVDSTDAQRVAQAMDTAEESQGNAEVSEPAPFQCVIQGEALASASVHTAVRCLNGYLCQGKIMEARNILCFLLDLVYFNVMPLDLVVKVLFQIIQLVEELVVAEDAQGDTDYLARVLVVGVLPWFPTTNKEIEDAASQCVDRLIELFDRNCDHNNVPRGLLVQDCDAVLQAFRRHSRHPERIKTLPRVLATAALPVVQEHPHYVVTEIERLTVTAGDIRCALSQSRINAAMLQDSGMALNKDLSLPGSCAYGAVPEPLWDDEAISRHLGGVHLMDVRSRWVLRQLFESVLYAFSEMHGLCAEALLRLPIAHDQFEIELINFVFSEMLRSPVPCWPPPLFFYRLVQSLACYQATLIPLIHEAIHLVVLHHSRWHPQILDTFAQFVATWLAQGTQLTSQLQQLAIERWTPTEVQRRWVSHWAPHGHVMTTLYHSDAHHDTVIEEQLPEALCEFLSQLMPRLMELVSVNTLRVEFPRVLLFFLPDSSCSSNASHDGSSEQELLHEYVFFKSILLHKFESETRRQIHCQRLETFLRAALLGKTRLCAPVCDAVATFIRGAATGGASHDMAPHFIKSEPGVCTGVVKREDDSTPEAAHNAAPLHASTVVIVKEQDHTDSTEQSALEVPEGQSPDAPLDASTVDDVAETSVVTLLEQLPLCYSDTPTAPWTMGGLIELFTRALIDHGCKTLTHTTRAVGNYAGFLDSLRHTYGERWEDHQDVEELQKPILKAIFASKSCAHRKRQVVIVKLFVRRNLVFPEVALQFIMDTVCCEDLLKPVYNDMVVWIIQNSALKLLEMCRNSAQGQALMTNSKDLEEGVKACYDHLCCLCTQYVVTTLSRFGRQDIHEDDEVVECFQAKPRCVNEDRLMREVLLRYMLGFASRFLYILNVDDLETKVDTLSADHRNVAMHFAAYVRDLQHYFFPVHPHDILLSMLQKLAVSIDSLCTVKRLDPHEELPVHE